MNIGDLTISNLYLGDTQALSACLGTQVVWSQADSNQKMYYTPLTFEIVDPGSATDASLYFCVSGVSYNYPPSAYGRTIYYVQKRNGEIVRENTETTTGVTYYSGQTQYTGFSMGFAFSAQAGDIIEVYGVDGQKNYASGYNTYHYFNCVGSAKVYGNINSLLVSKSTFDDYVQQSGSSVGLADECTFASLFRGQSGFTFNSPSEDKYLVIPEPSNGIQSYCCYYMFYNCSGLTTAPELPATTLASYCYNGMFAGCTGLTAAPELPATTLANSCCYRMFYGCTSLRTAPSILPATTLADNCYSEMFYSCSRLTTAPSILPATTLRNGCYQKMFYDCRSLTSAPALPATTLAPSCYWDMFNRCYNLTTAPSILPATRLTENCYRSMFNSCTNLTTAPELPATTLVNDCYRNMFQNARSLNYIKCLATKHIGLGTSGWLTGVASTGTFVKHPDVSWPVGTSGIPSGWDVQDADI